jgi:hypothetical protein
MVNIYKVCHLNKQYSAMAQVEIPKIPTDLIVFIGTFLAKEDKRKLRLVNKDICKTVDRCLLLLITLETREQIHTALLR